MLDEKIQDLIDVLKVQVAQREKDLSGTQGRRSRTGDEMAVHDGLNASYDATISAFDELIDTSKLAIQLRKDMDELKELKATRIRSGATQGLIDNVRGNISQAASGAFGGLLPDAGIRNIITSVLPTLGSAVKAGFTGIMGGDAKSAIEKAELSIKINETSKSILERLKEQLDGLNDKIFSPDSPLESDDVYLPTDQADGGDNFIGSGNSDIEIAIGRAVQAAVESSAESLQFLVGVTEGMAASFMDYQQDQERKELTADTDIVSSEKSGGGLLGSLMGIPIRALLGLGGIGAIVTGTIRYLLGAGASLLSGLLGQVLGSTFSSMKGIASTVGLKGAGVIAGGAVAVDGISSLHNRGSSGEDFLAEDKSFMDTRGGGYLQSVGGGALAGFSVGGPLGAAIGAGLGLLGAAISDFEDDISGFIEDVGTGIWSGLEGAFGVITDPLGTIASLFEDTNDTAKQQLNLTKEQIASNKAAAETATAEMNKMLEKFFGKDIDANQQKDMGDYALMGAVLSARAMPSGPAGGVTPGGGVFPASATGDMIGGKATKLTGTSKERAGAANKFFTDIGWSPEAAAGIVGNLLHESGNKLDPNAVGDHRFKIPGAPDGPGDGRAYGIAQWRLERAVGLHAFAAKRGKPWNDFETQLAYVDFELKGGGDPTAALAGKILSRPGVTVAESTMAVERHFERPKAAPGSKYSPSIGTRIANANGVFLNARAAAGAAVDPAILQSIPISSSISTPITPPMTPVPAGGALGKSMSSPAPRAGGKPGQPQMTLVPAPYNGNEVFFNLTRAAQVGVGNTPFW